MDAVVYRELLEVASARWQHQFASQLREDVVEDEQLEVFW